MRDDEKKKKLYENIKQEIRSLLISSPKTKYGGLSGSLLYFDYKDLNSGKEIPYAELGFHSFLALLRSMPDVVRIEHKENSPSYRVHPVYDQTTAHIQKMVLEQRDKYEHQNRLYSQNWYSNNDTQPNNIIPLNFYNNGQLPFLYNSFPCVNNTFNSVKTNFPISSYRTTNNFLPQSIPQKLYFPNDPRTNLHFQPYPLLPPQKRTYYYKQKENLNFQSIDSFPRLPSTSIYDHEICSTPNTFIETPTNFSFDDYRLNESIQINEKNTSEQNNNISSLDNQINANDDPLLTTSIDIIPDSPFNSNKSILPIIVDDKSDHSSNNYQHPFDTPASIIENDKSALNTEILVEIPPCNDEKQSETNENEKLLKRLNDAINNCIHFRYIHRLCELKFEYRHYPLSNETLSRKSNLEKAAFDKYKSELEDFEKTYKLNSSINEQKYETMFDEYVSLQRNYYYMIKLMKKRKR